MLHKRLITQRPFLKPAKRFRINRKPLARARRTQQFLTVAIKMRRIDGVDAEFIQHVHDLRDGFGLAEALARRDVRRAHDDLNWECHCYDRDSIENVWGVIELDGSRRVYWTFGAFQKLYLDAIGF